MTKSYINGWISNQIILTICIAGVSLGCALYFPLTLEDAYITFRYVRNWVGGEGYGVWNPGGERVEGFTTMLWMVLLSAAESVGISMFLASKVMGILSYASMPLLCMAAYKRSPDSAGASRFVVAALLISVNLPMAWYATSGMETVFFAALTLALLLVPHLTDRPSYQTVAGVALSSTMVLVRPEGLVLAGLINIYWLFTVWRDQRRIFTAPFWSGFVAGATFFAITIFRYFYFDDWVPNTYWAKASGAGWAHVIAGAKYVAKFILASLPLWIGFGALLFSLLLRRRIDRLTWFLLAVLVFYSTYLIKVGGDPAHAFPLFRQYLQIIGVWSVLIGSVVALSFNKKWQVVSMALLLAVLNNLAMINAHKDWLVRLPPRIIANGGYKAEMPAQEYFIWLNGLTDDDTTLAVSMAGRWPYYVNGTYIDILGLNNRHIAKHGVLDSSGVVDTKTDITYVLDQEPDVLDSVLSATELKAGVCPSALGRYRAGMLNGIRKNPKFFENYYFILNAPYETSLDRGLYAHRRFIERHKDELEFIPVSATALYDAGCGEPVPGVTRG